MSLKNVEAFVSAEILKKEFSKSVLTGLQKKKKKPSVLSKRP